MISWDHSSWVMWTLRNTAWWRKNSKIILSERETWYMSELDSTVASTRKENLWTLSSLTCMPWQNTEDLHDEMIRDRIVVGLRDTALSEKLQLDSKLTLEKAFTKARQAETVRQQQAVVQGDKRKPEVPIGAVHHGKGGRPKVATTQRRNPSQPMCYRCGHTPAHDRQQCPAKDVFAISAENEDILNEYVNQPK